MGGIHRITNAGLGAALAALLVAGAANAEDKKFALGVFHFNVQYVAGGLIEFPPGASSKFDLSAEVVEDRIITESFVPTLDLYEKHAKDGWGVDIELQGYLLDVLAARHPDVLDQLRRLAKSGQIDVVSFHYSDQLFIAFPQEDWERSQALTQKTFDKYDIPLSKTVFCQEGQAGMALGKQMTARGYETLIWPKNLWIYQQGNSDWAPLYAFGESESAPNIIVGGVGINRAIGADTVQVNWTFMDDGEKMATNDMDPYIAESFFHKAESVKEYEDKLLALEAQGFDITTVSKYVAAVRPLVTREAAPMLMDGTWQPNSTQAVFKWMGQRSIWPYSGDPADRDNHVRTLGALAHRELAIAEAAAEATGLDAREQLDSAWRLLFLGQVTDASGINPYRGEVEYGIAHLSESLRIARDVIEDAKAAEGFDQAQIDPFSALLEKGEGDVLEGATSEPLFEVNATVADPTRTILVKWEKVNEAHHVVSVTFGGGDPDSTLNEVAVEFPRTGDTFTTTLALDDATPVTFNLNDFTFQKPEFYMALPTGLIGLGGDRFLIKDQAFVHLAARISTETPELRFADQTQAIAEGVTWRFHVFEGSVEDAVALAHAVNVTRKVTR